MPKAERYRLFDPTLFCLMTNKSTTGKGVSLVLLSQQNSASFILDGKQVDIAAEDLMATAKPYFVMDGYDFVAYPNRNSVPFKEFYEIPEARTVVRGSLRYDGNPRFIKAFADIGWLDATKKDWLIEGLTWAQIHARITGANDSSE